MKRKIGMLIVCLIVIVLVVAFFIKINKIVTTNKEKIKSTEGIATVPTLEDEIQDNTIWCGTFQLIWNDLKNDIVKQDIVFNPQLDVIKNLNKETFTTKDIKKKILL